MSERRARLQAFVTGRVQGVFYRASAAAEARRLQVRGFARNLADGSVEIVAEGERTALEALLEWARKGPPQANVKEVQVEWAAYHGDFDQFRIR